MIKIGKKYRLKKLKGWFEKDSEEKRYNIELDNIRGFEDDFEK